AGPGWTCAPPDAALAVSGRAGRSGTATRRPWSTQWLPRGSGAGCPARLAGESLQPGWFRPGSGARDGRNLGGRLERSADRAGPLQVGLGEPVARPPGEERPAERVSGADRIHHRHHRNPDLVSDTIWPVISGLDTTATVTTPEALLPLTRGSGELPPRV